MPLLRRLFIVLLALTLLRFAFYLYNFRYFPSYSLGMLGRAFLGGFLSDIQIIAICFSPFILYHILPLQWQLNKTLRRIASCYYFLATGVILALSLTDMAYFSFSFQRLQYGMFRLISDSPVFSFFLRHYWYLPLAFLLSMALIIKGYKYRQATQSNLSGWRYWVFVFAIIGFMCLAITGGRARPMMPSDLSSIVPAEAQLLAMNTPQNILFTLYLNKFRSRKMLERKHYMKDEVADSLASAIYHPNKQESFKSYNVIIIVLESFSRAYLEPGNINKAYTPFLDSLRQESMVYTNAFANASISLGGLTSILGSIPPFTAASYMESPYTTNFIFSFGEALQTKGYSTHFFYGSNKDHYGFKRLVNQLGFTHYYSSEDFGDNSQNDGVWGIYDGPFLNYTAKTLSRIKTPFAAAIFNLSSHFPYAIPPAYAASLPKGKLISHQSITYVDLCLRDFMNQVKEESWFKESIFVFVADHWSKEDNSKVGLGPERFTIPLLIFLPDGTQKGIDNRVADQLDIIPTVADMMHLPVAITAFGKSLLDTNAARYSCSLQEFPNVFQIIGDSTVLLYNEKLEKVVAYYNYKKDILRDVPNELPDEAKQMERQLKAFIQVHNKVMIENKLMPKN